MARSRLLHLRLQPGPALSRPAAKSDHPAPGDFARGGFPLHRLRPWSPSPRVSNPDAFDTFVAEPHLSESFLQFLQNKAPRVEPVGRWEVLMDLSGCERLYPETGNSAGGDQPRVAERKLTRFGRGGGSNAFGGSSRRGGRTGGKLVERGDQGERELPGPLPPAVREGRISRLGGSTSGAGAVHSGRSSCDSLRTFASCAGSGRADPLGGRQGGGISRRLPAARVALAPCATPLSVSSERTGLGCLGPGSSGRSARGRIALASACRGTHSASTRLSRWDARLPRQNPLARLG